MSFCNYVFEKWDGELVVVGFLMDWGITLLLTPLYSDLTNDVELLILPHLFSDNAYNVISFSSLPRYTILKLIPTS